MKRIQSRFTLLASLLLASLAVVFMLTVSQQNVMAQTVTGAISGTVYDPSYAVVPKA